MSIDPKIIDHTLLNPEATEAEIAQLCAEAADCGFKSVCVHSSWVEYVRARLAQSPVIPVAVVGFPSGAVLTEVKAIEARLAVQKGAQEVDMVMNIGALKDRHHHLVFRDIEAVVRASQPAEVKVILETAVLQADEIVMACALARAAGASFVKTSTGFSRGGATVEAVRLMRSAVGSNMGVKASGGIRTVEAAQSLLAAGATRLGTSASVGLLAPGSKPEPGAY